MNGSTPGGPNDTTPPPGAPTGKATPMSNGSRVAGFQRAVRQRPAPIIIAAGVSAFALGGAIMYALATPGPATTHVGSNAASSSSGMQTDGSAPTVDHYGHTPDGTIAAQSTPRPLKPAYATSRRELADRRVAAMAPPDQSEAAILASHPAVPSWSSASTPSQASANYGGPKVNEPPRVAVVYDATTGRPTLVQGGASVPSYDVPTIAGSPPVGPPPTSAGTAGAVDAAARRAVDAVDGAHRGGRDATPSTLAAADGSREMVMPDVESTPGVVTIPAGSRIPAVLDGAVDSDLQGPVRAHITSDVCDPRTSDVAIPRGSWLIGNQGGGIINGTRHLGIVWLRLTYPDLSSRLLVATDTLDNEGHTGIAGRPNVSKFVTFRDTLQTSIASSAGQIAASALAPRFGGTQTVVVDPSAFSGVAGSPGGAQQRSQSWTIARNTPFVLYLERDYDRTAPYHGEKCGD